MSDKIILVTNPDEVFLDGLRILCIDLNSDQASILTSALKVLENQQDIIVYVWKLGDSIEWLIDKKHKSSLIFFNAESENQTIVGYMTAQNNSYYFGNLRDIKLVNNCVVFDVLDCKNILEKRIYE